MERGSRMGVSSAWAELQAEMGRDNRSHVPRQGAAPEQAEIPVTHDLTTAAGYQAWRDAGNRWPGETDEQECAYRQAMLVAAVNEVADDERGGAMSYVVSNSEWMKRFMAGKSFGLRWIDGGHSREVLRQIADQQPDACESARERELNRAHRAGVSAALDERAEEAA